MSCRGMVHDLHMDADSAGLTCKALDICQYDSRDDLKYYHILCMHKQPVNDLALIMSYGILGPSPRS